MKAHEKKAVERALDLAYERHESRFNEFGDLRNDEEYARDVLANEAVKIAQLRAGRTYSDTLRDEAVELAKNVIAGWAL